MGYKIALRLVEVLSYALEIDQSDDGYSKRDQCMAANVEWVLNEIDASPEKAFLWAHNAHVMYSDMIEAGTDKLVGTSLGKILKSKLKENIYSLALDFNKGSFIANEVKPDTIVKRVWTLDEAPQNTFPYLLSKTGMKVLFMDFNSCKNENLVGWLKHNKVSGHSIGGAYYPAYPAWQFPSYVLPERCDGLIFINDTHEITLDLH
jgi:erythromycin esterase-like protein